MRDRPVREEIHGHVSRIHLPLAFRAQDSSLNAPPESRSILAMSWALIQTTGLVGWNVQILTRSWHRVQLSRNHAKYVGRTKELQINKGCTSQPFILPLGWRPSPPAFHVPAQTTLGPRPRPWISKRAEAPGPSNTKGQKTALRRILKAPPASARRLPQEEYSSKPESRAWPVSGFGTGAWRLCFAASFSGCYGMALCPHAFSFDAFTSSKTCAAARRSSTKTL